MCILRTDTVYLTCMQQFLSRRLTKGNVVEKTEEGTSIENFSVGSWEDWPSLWLVAGGWWLAALPLSTIKGKTSVLPAL